MKNMSKSEQHTGQSLAMSDMEQAAYSVLAEHAPQTVETEAAWAAVAQRLAFTSTPTAATVTTSPAFVASAPATRRRVAVPRGRRWRFGLAGIAVALVAGIALTAAGYFGWAGPFSFSSDEMRQIGENHLYTRIGQTQESAGIALTLDSAYTDSGNTFIAYHVLPTSDATRSYSTFVPDAYSLRDQYGEELNSGGFIQCDAYHSGQPQYCLLSGGAYHPPAGVTQLTISLLIPELLLVQSGPNGVSRSLHVSWQFTFTLPYHQRSLGATIPGVQPTKQP